MIEQEDPDQGSTYQIQVLGQIDTSWSDWFDGMTFIYEHGRTTFTGHVADQAALRGILFKVWDLNLELISVNRIEQLHAKEKQ
jgi:hypothetical protein